MELLEDTDMEGVMDVGGLWRMKQIGDVVDAFGHLKWPSILGAELATWPGKQGLHQSVEELEPYPVANLEA
jgi:hypothetical protein